MSGKEDKKDGTELRDIESGYSGEGEDMIGGTSTQYSTFAAKKTVAQGMMDIALITANANQLRYLIEFQRNSPTFWVILILIVTSLVLQVVVGVFLIFKRRLDLRGEEKRITANQMNNYVVITMFFITIINVFIGTFSVTGDVLTTPIAAPKT